MFAIYPSRSTTSRERPLVVLFCLDHNRTKIGRIRVLTYFGSAMSDIHLGSGNIEKFP